MFNRLRLKFILINMGLLTTVFIAIFGTIYAMTNKNIEIDMTRELEVLIRGNHKPKPYYSYIILDLDDNKNIINSFASFDACIEDNLLKDAIDKILESKRPLSNIKIDSSSYLYLKQPTPFGEKIALLDRAYQQQYTFQLVKSFIVVGSISLVALLVISIYLTNKTIKPIKDTFEKQKQFIAYASHELKTPLTIIKTNTSLVLSNPDDTVRNQAKWINYISSQCDRMSELISEMLSLAKLDIDDNQVNLYPVNISKTIQSMLLGFDAIIYENGIHLEENISNDIFINGNNESIKKLFSIIMDNAIKHTNKNGKISVDLSENKNSLSLNNIKEEFMLKAI